MEQFHDMSDGNINISDVIEVIQTTDPGFVECSGKEDQLPLEMNTGRLLPYVEIIEQPASKALRFRYECEGRSAGSIPGVNSTPENKTFPSIRIVGYKGRAVVVVSCVTKDQPHRPHPHNLVGKEACKRGVCTVEVSSENMTVTFANLGIQCVKKKDIEEALKIREEIRVDPFRTGFEHKRQPTSIDLNAVRLCFQVFLEGGQKGKFNVPLPPVVSDPIFDKKAMSDLVICKLSHSNASVAGGMEMILLCEKVAKEDIQVRFFEEKEGQVIWEGFGDFQPVHVHKQTAIAFKTPTYRMQQVEQPVQICIQLKRPSDGATSEPLPFQMLPLGAGRPAFWSLRKAFARKKTDYSTFSKILATESALFSNVTPKFPRNVDEYNNNDDFNVKKSSNKISALRALNDLYNVKNTLDSCNGNIEMNQNISQNVNHIKSTIIDYQNNEIPINEEKQTRENEQINRMYKIDNRYIDKEMNDDNSGTLSRTKSDSTAENTCVFKQNADISKNNSDWFDYSEVGKWVQKGQMCLKEKDNETDFKTETTEDCNKSFNELLTQVAELDQIYADTHTKLVQAAIEQNTTDQSMDIDVCDNQTYTSLQMAMKNPIEFIDLPNERKYEDVCIPKADVNQSCPSPPVTTKRDGTQETEERLPPLPPKRIRKMPSMPLLPRPISSHMTSESFVEAPNKTLPSLPATLTKNSKQGLFSKLFAKKAKKDKDSISNVSKENSQPLCFTGNVSYMTTNNTPTSPQLQISRPSAISTNSVKSLKLEGDETPPYGIELTEAEHYALYTAMAPHATVSEFDEMSFYYSPVEGGKIYSEKKET
ncbi:embryonic polarity protein dorsal-like isoform X1 [Bombus affinis]|uniref:embryonic polarity protein dorsal-like isoform X1 n=1 Tax=Bombus affinis TaxID=309941 RepID=UPI0021B7B37C|nr:embryonic polarity protein dorsal-like isoform X1 [Bombus affinis]XP_050573941.1 embryonic polarity protein dorsal-like isoform X1 [Bombus affinis]XP_050573943.1 embryonic polarity protein dorsal-like isoform X1 [Bombus affinis]XP_050573944.1 embryonic polarity protein dorsal-like isoform X1 [Bombus affinis]